MTKKLSECKNFGNHIHWYLFVWKYSTLFILVSCYLCSSGLVSSCISSYFRCVYPGVAPAKRHHRFHCGIRGNCICTLLRKVTLKFLASCARLLWNADASILCRRFVLYRRYLSLCNVHRISQLQTYLCTIEWYKFINRISLNRKTHRMSIARIKNLTDIRSSVVLLLKLM